MENLNDIVTLSKLHDIKQNDIKWEELYSLYDTEKETETESVTDSDTESDKSLLIDHIV